MKIAVVTPKSTNGEKGGAENLYEGLIKALIEAGHDATQVEVVVDESTFDGILEAYCNCFYLDLSDFDLVISTKAPTYMVRHRNHISYLLHTVRVFYDMFDLELNPENKEIQKQRKLIHELDKYGLSPNRTKKHAVIGDIVAERLKNADAFWTQINFEKIYPATKISDFKEPKTGEFIFLPGRLHRWKRVDLVIEAMRYVPGRIKLLIAGDGEAAINLRSLVSKEGLEERVEFLGRISDDKLLELYSRAIVVPFVPVQEDFGYVTIEAFKSRKPVITCSDSGEPSHIVEDGFSGFVVGPDPKKIAEKINYFIENPDEATRMGENGYQSVKNISWENAVKRLLDIPLITSPPSWTKVKSVLVTDNQILDPPIGGGRVRIYELYKNFDPAKFNITYLGTFDWLGPGEREQKLANHFKEILVPMTALHISLDKLISKLCGGVTTLDVTVPILMKYTPKYQRRLSHLIKDKDIIIVSHPWVYHYVQKELKSLKKRPLLVYDSHNVEYKIKRALLSKTLCGMFLANQVKKIESIIIKECDLVFACSHEDSKGFSDQYGVKEEKILVVPNGASIKDITYPTYEMKTSMKNHFGFEGSVATFLASGGYKPNDDAADYICSELARRLSTVTFVLVGSICEGISKKYGEELEHNIKLMGIVNEEDKRGLLTASDVALNPVAQGSGTNIKVFDYLAAGLPLVTTSVGARGIDFTDKLNTIIADIGEFPEAIETLLKDAGLRDKLSKGARSLAERYDWKDIAKIAEDRI